MDVILLSEAALSALAKLRQVMPKALGDRVDTLAEMVVGVPRTRRSALTRANGSSWRT